jgi:hypothetical protein
VACSQVLVAQETCKEGGCAVLLVVGCAGVRSEAPQQEQGRSLGAASEEDDRCGTRTIDRGIPYTTNDVPGCPSGGVLRGTEKDDKLAGESGEDEVRGLGGADTVEGGVGNDKVYGGPGDDEMMGGGAMDSEEPGNDVLYGGPGRDDMGGDGATMCSMATRVTTMQSSAGMKMTPSTAVRATTRRSTPVRVRMSSTAARAKIKSSPIRTGSGTSFTAAMAGTRISPRR